MVVVGVKYIFKTKLCNKFMHVFIHLPMHLGICKPKIIYHSAGHTWLDLHNYAHIIIHFHHYIVRTNGFTFLWFLHQIVIIHYMHSTNGYMY